MSLMIPLDDKSEHIAMTLIDIEPRQVVTDFQNEREKEVSASTFRDYKYTLRRFLEFCDEKDIEYMSDVNGYHLNQFRSMRQNEGIKNVTLKNNLSYMRVFMSWCESAELVSPGLADKITLPDLSTDEEVSETTIDQTRVEDILGAVNVDVNSAVSGQTQTGLEAYF